jgi:hypothetical protein
MRACPELTLIPTFFRRGRRGLFSSLRVLEAAGIDGYKE